MLIDSMSGNRFTDLKKYVTTYNKNIDILACPKDPRMAMKIDGKFIPLVFDLAKREYDVVLVNIVADVIIGLAPVLSRFLTEKSMLICSGILDVRLEEVLAALTAAGLRITAVKAQGDWRCVTACRNI